MSENSLCTVAEKTSQNKVKLDKGGSEGKDTPEDRSRLMSVSTGRSEMLDSRLAEGTTEPVESALEWS
jgi:hypothetical protein